MAAEAGKGSSPRKQQDLKAYAENHSKIFGNTSWLDRKKEEERRLAMAKAAIAQQSDENQRFGLYG